MKFNSKFKVRFMYFELSLLQALDVLDEFLALYRTNLTDWGATILAKALYLQSMKQTQSNFDRVMRLLDTLHRSFPYDLQLNWCFSILESKQVASNSKMKVNAVCITRWFL